MTRPKTKTQIAHFNYLFDVLKRLEWDLHHPIAQKRIIPSAWHDIAAAPRVSEKQRITLWVERDVVRFFKSQGAGYQPRMNDVLKAFMHTRLSGIIRGAEEIDEYFFDKSETEARPDLGSTDAEWIKTTGKRGPDWEE